MHCVYEGLQLPIDAALTGRVALVRADSALQGSGRDDSHAVSVDERAGQGRAASEDVPPTKVKKIGIIGAGFMGAGVGYVARSNGLEVVLLDRDQESADKGKAGCEELIAGQVSRGRATAADQAALLARIEATADYAGLKDCDLVSRRCSRIAP